MANVVATLVVRMGLSSRRALRALGQAVELLDSLHDDMPYREEVGEARKRLRFCLRRLHPTTLVSLESHNERRGETKMVYNGIACPDCASELKDEDRGQVADGWLTVLCVECGFVGRRVV